MKLLTKTSLIFITVSLFVFFVSGIVLYRVIKKLTDENINKELYSAFHSVSQQLRHASDTAFNDFLLLSDEITLQEAEVINPALLGSFQLNDTLLKDDLTGAYQPYRYFKGYVIKGGKIYGLTTFKSLIESNDLIEQITLTFTIMTLLLVVGVFFLMRILGQRLWSSFFVALEQVKNFDVTRRERIIFRDTDIYEFNVLNESLEKLIKRIQQDFINLKEFTENITHEIQTPLAVIRSKTELLLQNPDLTSEQAQLLSSISNSLRRLTKLNHGLVLLTKIENNQFHKTEPVIINHIINQVLENYEDFMEAKNLRLEKLFNEELIIKMNPVLADVLVQNLLKNAVVHNINNGWIRIIIDKEALQLSNTGLKSKKNSNLLFKRFAHGEFRPESMGIGLSLVKKICDYYGIAIEYSIKEEVHTLTLMPEAFER